MQDTSSRCSSLTNEPRAQGMGCPSPALHLFHVVLALLVLAAGTLVGLSGCATAHARGGSSLSEAVVVAAHQSRDRNEKDRDRDDREDDEDVDQDRDDRAVLRVIPDDPTLVVRHRHGGPGSCDTHCRRDEEPSGTLVTWFLGASFDGLDRSQSTLAGGGQFTLRAGAFAPNTGERLAVELDGTVGHANASRGLDAGIKSLYEFTAGAAMRVYGPPAHAAAGFYGTAGIRGGVLRWDYASPLLVDDGYEFYEIGTDFVEMWSPYVGGGVTFFRESDLQLDIALLRGVQFYGDVTDQGFHNDVFDTGSYTAVRVGVIGVFR